MEVQPFTVLEGPLLKLAALESGAPPSQCPERPFSSDMPQTRVAGKVKYMQFRQELGIPRCGIGVPACNIIVQKAKGHASKAFKGESVSRVIFDISTLIHGNTCRFGRLMLKKSQRVV